MERQLPYADSSINPYTAAQMQQMSTQRMHHNDALNNYTGRTDSFPAEQGHPYVAARTDRHWQWDSDVSKVSNPILSHPYIEGQGGSAARSLYEGQMRDPKVDVEKQANKEARVQSHEQDMEIGYEDNPPPLTFEGLEKKFQDEILKLIKEHGDAEDAENARHRENVIEINNKYQEKLLSLRAQQSNKREEFLRKESLARLHQHQQAEMSHRLIRAGSNDPHGYDMSAAATDAHRAYATVQYDSYRGQSPFLAGGRNQGIEGRIPFPEGRATGQYDSYRDQSPLPGGGISRGTEGRVPYPEGRVYRNNTGTRYD